MKRSEIIERYGVRDGIIRASGNFQGQNLYVPYFWEAYLNGEAHEVSLDHVALFAITEEDRKEFPELMNRSVIRLREMPTGKIMEE